MKRRRVHVKPPRQRQNPAQEQLALERRVEPPAKPPETAEEIAEVMQSIGATVEAAAAGDVPPARDEEAPDAE